MAKDKFTVKAVVGDGKQNIRVVSLEGRVAWALAKLHAAGEQGCTPIDTPGPRWSDYVFKLKRQHAINVETIHEGHKGTFAGRHGRYVLRTRVRLLQVNDPQRRAQA